jgi:cytochrome c oxidase accessory protein FixG
VLLDRKSLIVAYDPTRGEPRGKKGKVTGDCVDCGICVVTCPTGIDIRNGLQLECIACAQCIDGCDSVMDKLGRPRGLIRYTSEDALETRTFSLRSLLRPRVFIYPVILAGLVTMLGITAAARKEAEVSVLRGIGAPFVEQGDLVRDLVRIKVINRTEQPRDYALAVIDDAGATLVAPENPLALKGGEQRTESVFVLCPRRAFVAGTHPIHVRVSTKGFERTFSYQLLGPAERGGT